MKKYLLVLLIFITPILSKAQGKAYEEGDKIANLGISLGYFGYGYFGDRTGFSIPINASLEYGITEEISVGPYIGYARWNYEYFNGLNDTEYSWTFVSAGARGSFHLTPLINEWGDGDIDEEKFDLYVSAILGLEFRSYKDDFGGNDYYNNETVLRFGPNLGMRYLFTENFGFYVEGGRGTFGWLNFGVTGRF